MTSFVGSKQKNGIRHVFSVCYNKDICRSGSFKRDTSISCTVLYCIHEQFRTFYDKEFLDFFLSPNIIWIVKSRRLRWDRDVARIGGRGSK